MPRLTGPDLALNLYKIDPGIKIIVFSALDRGTASDWIGKMEVKFDHFSMPVTKSELLEMINNKIKYGKFDESDIIRRRIRRHRLRKLSPDWYFRLLRYQLRHRKRNN